VCIYIYIERERERERVKKSRQNVQLCIDFEKERTGHCEEFFYLCL
jgi:hypothetical protein